MKKLMKLISKSIGDSELLTEAVQTELKTEIEKMINEKVESDVKVKTEVLEESYNQKLASYIEEGETKQEEYKTLYESKINEYLTDSVNEFIETNEVALSSGIKVERSEKLVEGIKTLLNECNISITEDENDVVSDLETSNQALKDSNETLITKLQESTLQTVEYQKVVEFGKLSNDLTDVQKEEALKLYEGIQSSTIEDFINQMKIIVEKVRKEDVAKGNTDDTDSITESLTRAVSNGGNGKANRYL